MIERQLRGLSDRVRTPTLAVLLAPFLFPELVVGYAYRPLTLSMPDAAEWLCSGLLFLRVVPIGVVTLLASPADVVSAAAIHTRRLLQRTHSITERWRLWQCYWQGPVRRSLPAVGLMSIVAFQEFELAALLQTASWTDWFVAAQRVGLDQSIMQQQTWIPVAMQVPLLFAALFWLWRSQTTDFEQREQSISDPGTAAQAVVGLYLLAACGAGCVYPSGVIMWNLPGGLGLLARQPSQALGLGREMIIAIAISLLAGLTTWIVARFWVSRNNGGAVRLATLVTMLLPGLFGSLLLSLGMVAAFQFAWFRPVYDSPIPWVLALMVWLLPRAALLRLWLMVTTPGESVHLAGLMASTPSNPRGAEPSSRSGQRRGQSSALLFRLRDQPQLLAIGLLCYWAYLDLPTAYLLAPSGMTSGLVRLYNFMHFGRSAALSAEAFVFFGFPFVGTVIAWQFFRAVREVNKRR